MPTAVSRILSAVCLCAALAVPLTPGPAPAVAAPAPRAAADPVPTTTFRMATFNVLGAAHTDPGGNRPGFALGKYRMVRALRLLGTKRLDIVGFQELEQPQFDVLRNRSDDKFDWYPGEGRGRVHLRNTIVWRADTWELVGTSQLDLPYFYGDLLPMPVIRLRHRVTGQEIFAMNFQFPSDSRGDAEKWRRRGQGQTIALINQLREETGLPVFLLGDMNARTQVFCRVTRQARMVSASGGERTDTTCRPAPPVQIDWIFGSAGTVFSDYEVDKRGYEGRGKRRISDHPLVTATVTVGTATEPPPSE